MRKISECEITDKPKEIFDPMPSVIVKFDDGAIKKLFDFYPDELSFTPNEFIGLTEVEALELKFKKDMAYLRN